MKLQYKIMYYFWVSIKEPIHLYNISRNSRHTYMDTTIHKARYRPKELNKIKEATFHFCYEDNEKQTKRMRKTLTR